MESGTFLTTPVLTLSRADEEVNDDRASIQPGVTENVLLIVDDDPHYARVLLGLARDKGFKGLVANRGEKALALTREYRHGHHVGSVPAGYPRLVDYKQPEAGSRHAAHPVQMISVVGSPARPGAGRVLYLVKPATTAGRKTRWNDSRLCQTARQKLLVVEDNEFERRASSSSCSTPHRDRRSARVGKRCTLFESSFDCCVVVSPAGHERVRRSSGLQSEQRLRDV